MRIGRLMGAGLLPALYIGIVCGALGCGGDEGELPPALTLSTNEIDFGVVPITTEGSLNFTLTNSGGGEIRLDSISLIEGTPGAWDVRRDDDGALGASESSSVTVLFSPSSEIAYSGRIQVRTSAAGGSQYVTLKGTGGPSDVDGDGDGFSAAAGDCDDKNPDRFPGNSEVCDGIDNNCDGVVPVSESDDDYDGFRLCSVGGSPVDCDDTDSNVYPGAEEICDDKDSDCNGVSNDRVDQDGDGQSVCDDDCDDEDPEVAPALDESCDGKDNDCDGLVDNRDADGDGHSLCDGSGDCDDEDPERHPIIVEAGAGGEGADGSPANPYGTLGEALGAGENGDEDCPIVLLEGSYIESLTLRGDRHPWVEGESRDGVLITSLGEGPALTILEGATLSMATLTIGNGASPTDGGAVVVQEASLELENVRLKENVSGGDGGAITLDNSDLALAECLFVDNVAADDGGAIAAIASAIIDEGSTFQGNQGKRGGALFMTSADLTMAGSLFDNNAAGTEGGAAFVGAGSSISLRGLRFWENSASGSGGAMSFSDLDDEDSVVEGSRFQDNVAGGDGGGLAIRGSKGAVSVRNNTFTSNVAGGAGEAGLGAGVYVGDVAGDVQIVSNILAWGRGSTGLHRLNDEGVTSYNSVFNTSGGLQFGGSLSGLNHEVGAPPPADSEGRVGNRNENPAFTEFAPGGAPEADDLRLRQDSPCRDSGPEEEQFKDTDGSRNDRGAFGGPFPAIP